MPIKQMMSKVTLKDNRFLFLHLHSYNCLVLCFHYQTTNTHISNTYWERDFNKWLEETYVNVDKSRSVVLREEYVNNVLEHLLKGKCPENMTPQQRSSFKFKAGSLDLLFHSFLYSKL